MSPPLSSSIVEQQLWQQRERALCEHRLQQQKQLLKQHAVVLNGLANDYKNCCSSLTTTVELLTASLAEADSQLQLHLQLAAVEKREAANLSEKNEMKEE